MMGEEQRKTWGSWEELLLACAVKRHGFDNWDSVSMELQTKTSLSPHLSTPHYCKQKYLDLKRRFQDDSQDPAKVVNIPWLEHLRLLRVQELKQDLLRYDVSILSLQLKVKRLEEERGPSLDNGLIHTRTITNPTPDLNNQHKADKNQLSEPRRRLISSEDSEKDNRSVNESNSTQKGDGGGDGDFMKTEPEVVRTGLGEVDGDNSDSSDEDEREGESDELSSVSFGRKRKRKGGRRRRSASGEDGNKESKAKSDPLIRLLEMIRTHKQAPLFERRLQSLESNMYKETVRRHMDLESIQRKVEQGHYSSSILAFYRDLLVVFNNTILCFPYSSLESQTARHLRHLVSTHIPIHTSTNLLPKHTSSSSLCPKPCSVTSKPPTVEANTKSNTTQDIIITTTRSSRRNNPPTPPPAEATPGSSSKMSNKKQKASTQQVKQQTPLKTRNNDNKSCDSSSSAQNKRKSVVDFLKRIKKNSPTSSSSSSRNHLNVKPDQRQKRIPNGREKVTRKTARDHTKLKKEEISPRPSGVKRNGGRLAKTNKRGMEVRGSSGKEAVRHSKRVRR